MSILTALNGVGVRWCVQVRDICHWSSKRALGGLTSNAGKSPSLISERACRVTDRLGCRDPFTLYFAGILWLDDYAGKKRVSYWGKRKVTVRREDVGAESWRHEAAFDAMGFSLEVAG